jgi:C2 domain
MGSEVSKENQELSAVMANESSNDVDEVVQKAFSQGINSLPSTDINIRISASDLPNTDKGSLTDPYAALYIKNGSSEFQYLGMTEVITNTLNPSFIKQFTTKFYFEEKQIIQLNIYDKGSKGNLEDFKNQECVGTVTTTLAEVFALKEKSFNLINKYSKGKAKIQCEVVKESRISVCIKMLLPIANAFLLISKRQQNWVPIYKSEVTKDCLTELKTIRVAASLLCDNDNTLPIQFQVYIHSNAGNHKLYGELCMALSQLVETQELKTGGTLNN